MEIKMMMMMNNNWHYNFKFNVTICGKVPNYFNNCGQSNKRRNTDQN
jgi:hypothetical protein